MAVEETGDNAPNKFLTLSIYLFKSGVLSSYSVSGHKSWPFFHWMLPKKGRTELNDRRSFNSLNIETVIDELYLHPQLKDTEYVEAIIQHPEGGPKQIALNENRVTNICKHYVQYTTDTLPGSSGSSVFNDNWEVVALHHAGGLLKTNDKGDIRFINEAIAINYLPL